jgi:hypothetical protein
VGREPAPHRGAGAGVGELPMWLKRCHGADILRAEWLELELWAPTLWMALRIPRSAETAKVAIAANLPRQHVDDR